MLSLWQKIWRCCQLLTIVKVWRSIVYASAQNGGTDTLAACHTLRSEGHGRLMQEDCLTILHFVSFLKLFLTLFPDISAFSQRLLLA